VIKEFTGISDLYEERADADITIDTTTDISPDEASNTIMLHLKRLGFIAAAQPQE
jgi:sulfate adenylyltransferase